MSTYAATDKNESVALPQAISSSSSPKLTIGSVSYATDSRALTRSANIVNQGVSKPLSLTGNLYNSYKRLDGVNSVVGILEDTTGNYNVLLFNIYNSTEKSDFNIYSDMIGTPHLKLYLTDALTGDMLFFELDIPSELALISIDASDENICPNMLFDMLLFANVVEADANYATDEEIDSNSIQIRSTNGGIKVLRTIRMDWDITGILYHYYTSPMIIYSLSDIHGSNPSYWALTFATRNGYCVSGDTTYELTAIEIKKFRMSIATDEYTVFTGQATTGC